MPIFKEVDTAFFKQWTPEMAYVLGFFAADGNMITNKRGGRFVSFYSTDRGLLEKIRAVLDSSHKIGVRHGPTSWRTSYVLQIGSKQLYEDLLSLGLTPRKSNTLQLPVVPSLVFADFVRGYFDGDGCIYFKRHFVRARQNVRWVFSSRFTSGSKSFLIALHEKLQDYGLVGGFIVDKNRGYELIFSHKDSVALARLMYDTISRNGLYLERKYQLFQKAIKTLYGDVAQW